ncbi:Peptide deformylase 2 [compost metagenome]|uniref:Peptide deformylase n=1 Tax=Paenibacillus rhizolycopersici TaxID=2780073 RepID=A0ABS2H7G8_9BACL|nr:MULTISPECIES: peptide deformylase [Paenibacillus]MBM6996783.1 peptide deformylase [Paenibacillus rhizolycopersici]MUG88161.1 peptide deformylase [Paenibacillus timonensis]GIP50136.1 peptide deformylase [Paenibacillus sp. J53TS2]
MSKFNRDYIITMDDIVREGEPILRVVTEPVSVPPTEEDREEMAAMLQFLKNSQDPEMAKKYKLRAGVGLSANQIGLNKRMFAALLTDENGQDRPIAMYNPKIISHSQAMTYLPESEGCLSVDRPVQGFVPRYEKVQIKACDEAGNEVKLRFKGFDAIVMQHEIDHLNGIMFYDHINTEHPFKLPSGVTISSLY